MEGVNSCNPTTCTLYAAGNVSCSMPCEHTAYCDGSDYANWPFDVQQCQYNYVPKQDLKQLNFVNRSVAIDYDNALISQDWDLRTIKVNSEIILNEYNVTQPSITIKFVIERYSHGHLHQIIIPAVVLMIINISLLMLNPESPERVILYVINLFSHCLFVEQLKWM